MIGKVMVKFWWWYWRREDQGRIMPGAAAPGKLPGKSHFAAVEVNGRFVSNTAQLLWIRRWLEQVSFKLMVRWKWSMLIRCEIQWWVTCPRWGEPDEKWLGRGWRNETLTWFQRRCDATKKIQTRERVLWTRETTLRRYICTLSGFW